MRMADEATKLYAMASADAQTHELHAPHQLRQRRAARSVWPVVVLCATLGILPWPSPGHAQSQPESASDRAALQSDYDQVIDRAVTAFQAEDYAQAHELFEQAHALQPNARVLRGLGIAALRLGHYTEAKRQLEAALADKRQPLTATHRSEVSKLLAWIRGNLGILELRWKPREPADTRVFCDDELVRDHVLVLLPGPHRLSVSAAGFKPQIHVEQVRAEETQTLDLKLEPEVPPPASPTPNADRIQGPRRVAQPVAVAALTPKQAAATVNTTEPSGAVSVVQTPHAHGPSERRDAPASSSVLTRWWFWTGIAVLAVGGGVATALALKGASTSPTYESGGEAGVHLALERGR